MLPKSKDPLGYTQEEIKAICKKQNIKMKDFNKSFGINTCTLGKDNTPRYYKCDIENALFKLKAKDGKFHQWD